MDISLLLPLLIALAFIPLFLSGRRQRKQMAEMQRLQSALQPGDEVMTTSGLRATVVDISHPDVVELEIAPDVTTIWIRAAIRERVNPVADEPDLDSTEPVDASDATAEPVTADAGPAAPATAAAAPAQPAATEAAVSGQSGTEQDPKGDDARTNGRA